ncbi:MAG: polysaccharide pyruvyl transferase family protein [Chloroflexota bacterium]
MSNAFLLLHRALRNAGDALIFERARRLIAAEHPSARLDVAEAWRPLADQLPSRQLATYRAIVICGGPGYGPGMAGRYPLGDVGGLPPLVLLALGSYVTPGTTRQLASYRIDGDDRNFLEAVLARTPWLGARDPLTAGLLARNAFQRVLMTGDPAWYDMERIEDPVRAVFPPTRVAFTPPANPVYFAQARHLFETVAARWPEAAVTLVHHRGIQRPFARLAEARGWTQRDITGGWRGFEVYNTVDLHVGYRLHAHLYATSVGTPSYVVAEDSRGTGALRAMPGLGVPGFNVGGRAFRLQFLMGPAPRLANAQRPILNRVGPALGLLAGTPQLSDLAAQIAEDARMGYPHQVAAREIIRATLPTMRKMIMDLP